MLELWTGRLGAVRRITVLAAVLCGSPACGPSYTGVVDAHGYSNEKYTLTVAATADQQILPSNWRLDNLYGPENKAKKAEDYLTTYRFDIDGDGQYEGKQQDFIYELRFENVKTGALIWLRMLPISATDAQKLPRVLLRDYVESIAQTGYEVTVFSSGVSFSAKTRFATDTLAEAEGTVAGAPAHATTLNVANVDQVQVEKSARVSRVKLVLARPQKLEYEVSAAKSGVVPVALIAGYANHPDDFAADLPVFENFLARIGVDGQSGAALRETRSAAPPPAPAEPAAPATTPEGAPEPVSAAP